MRRKCINDNDPARLKECTKILRKERQQTRVKNVEAKRDDWS